MVGGGSIVVRRQLGRELRSWRERSRHTLDDVAAAQIASVSKVHRIEHGRTAVRPGDVRELCRLYGVGETTTETLADLARATRAPDWWERQHTSTAPWFALYLQLEEVAGELFTFQPVLVPGLFQTEEYARQVHALTEFEDDEVAVERYVQTRMTRQQRVFARGKPLRIHLVLGEAALLTSAGPASVMEAQRESLRRHAAQEAVEIRVLPLSRGLHPGMKGPFSILEFPKPDDPPVAYIETYEAARYPESPAQVARYRRRFERLWDLAVMFEEYLQ